MEVPKNQKKYNCEKCNYHTNGNKDFEKHLLTAKHKRQHWTKDLQQEINLNEFLCECGKIYNHRASLFNHKKKCYIIEEKPPVNDKKSIIGSINEETILNLIQENKEIKQMLYVQNETTNKLIDIIPKVNNNTTNNNTINNNQKFNINIFLNEKCKDAIDIKEFISQIQLTLENLDFSRTQGLEAGLTNVIIENMNKLSLYERPIHCTDTKRETLYIKDDDKWEKDKDKTKIKEALKSLNKNHFKLIKQWLDNNPDYMEDNNKQAYFAKILKTCGAILNDEKIIKKICTSNYIKNHIKDLDENLIE